VPGQTPGRGVPATARIVGVVKILLSFSGGSSV
jgi:hypothetical protein